MSFPRKSVTTTRVSVRYQSEELRFQLSCDWHGVPFSLVVIPLPVVAVPVLDVRDRILLTSPVLQTTIAAVLVPSGAAGRGVRGGGR